MEFQRYTNFFYYFENIKIPMSRKREQIKRIIADVKQFSKTAYLSELSKKA